MNDHRIALSISPNVTVLWDQIASSGSPTEFAYVIPAKPVLYPTGSLGQTGMIGSPGLADAYVPSLKGTAS